MSIWRDTPCFHRTLLLTATEGDEYLVIFCRFCNKCGFSKHRRDSKLIFDPQTFATSTKSKCTITCSECKRDLQSFPHGNQAFVLDFLFAPCRPHHELTVEEKSCESTVFKPICLTDNLTTTTTAANSITSPNQSVGTIDDILKAALSQI